MWNRAGNSSRRSGRGSPPGRGRSVRVLGVEIGHGPGDLVGRGCPDAHDAARDGPSCVVAESRRSKRSVRPGSKPPRTTGPRSRGPPALRRRWSSRRRLATKRSTRRRLCLGPRTESVVTPRHRAEYRDVHEATHSRQQGLGHQTMGSDTGGLGVFCVRWPDGLGPSLKTRSNGPHEAGRESCVEQLVGKITGARRKVGSRLTLTHKSTGIEVTGEVPTGHYSDEKCNRRSEARRGSLCRA